MVERYKASMVLSGVGDALGYNRGEWEFNHSGREIYEQLMAMTNNKGVGELKLDKNWIVSDDTVLHIATAEGLILWKQKGGDLFPHIARQYKRGMKDMASRAPGGSTVNSMYSIGEDGSGWDQISYSRSAGGCGAAMRAMCIGLAYPKEDQLDTLIEIAVESGRMTHHNGTGFLGSVAAAAFTAYCIQGVPLKNWGFKLLDEVLPRVKVYLERAKRDAQECISGMDYFIQKWEEYLATRALRKASDEGPTFPQEYDFEQRDEFYNKCSFSGWGGSSGHDAPMIAWDAMLFAKNDWNTLMYHATIHGGDSDSTGVMAGAWYGALYGFTGVPKHHYDQLEYGERLASLGQDLYDLFIRGVGASSPGMSSTSSASSTIGLTSTSSSNARSASGSGEHQ